MICKISWRNPVVIKAVIRFVIAALLIVGIDLPEGSEETFFGWYLWFETFLTLRSGTTRH